MKRAGWLGLAIAWTACGDNGSLSPEQLVARLRGMPGVTVEEQPTRQAGYHYYVLHVTQPVDHDNPGHGTFQQEVSLLHHDTDAPTPMIVSTTGYSDYTHNSPAELTTLLAANQVSIEHRYFGTSRPEPADWTRLTIAQAAADEHAIIAALRTIYGGAFLTTGASKGGMTAVFHRRFYPGDVEGTVPYVAPISFGVPDARYGPFFATLGPADCHQAVEDAATEMLAHRRDAMVAHAASLPMPDGHTRVALGAAVEEAIGGLEWSFWQYTGVTGCAGVPPVTADDDTLFAFLQNASPIDGDRDVAFFEAYVYQAYAQLGFPAVATPYLDPYLRYGGADYDGELPTAVPAYDGAAMHDIDDFVQHDAERLLFVYGGWDPWTGGKFALGAARDSALYVVDQGTHGSEIAALAAADRDAALARLEAWTGVAPDLKRLAPSATGASPRSQAIEAMPPPRVRPPRLRR